MLGIIGMGEKRASVSLVATVPRKTVYVNEMRLEISPGSLSLLSCASQAMDDDPTPCVQVLVEDQVLDLRLGVSRPE